MADKYQTQCPHCGVKFQISDQQLALANGNVRCGSCLQVFQASKNLVPITGTAAPSGVGSARSAAPVKPPAAADRTQVRPAIAPPPARRPPAPAPAPEVPADEDLADMILDELAQPAAPAPKPVAPRPPAAREPVVDDDDLADMILRELENKPAPKAAPPAPPPPASRQQAGPPPAAPQWSAPPQQPAEPQWAPPAAAAAAAAKAAVPPANRYGIEDNKTRVSLGKGHDKTLIDDDDMIDNSRTDNRIVQDDDLDVFGGGAATYVEKVDEPVDESWAKELLGEKVEDEKDALVRKFTEFTADNMSLATTGVQEKSALQRRLSRLDKGLPDDTPAPLSRTAGGGDGMDVDDLDFLNDGALTMQDVELPGIETGNEFDTVGMAHQVEWGRQIFWGTLCAIFALLLLGQYLVFNFNNLSRDQSWRGVYEVACGAIGCELPGESDVTRIQGANLVIRNHPKIAGALIVDAIVYNRAPFAQPYPDLELSFSDRSGTLLAGRVFTASEYLKGELAGSEEMPPDTPVHLSLELVDPGSNAVNYELRLLPPATSS